MAEYHNGSVSLAKKEDSEVVAESVGGVVVVVVGGGGVGSGVVADAALLAELVMLSRSVSRGFSRVMQTFRHLRVGNSFD